VVAGDSTGARAPFLGAGGFRAAPESSMTMRQFATKTIQITVLKQKNNMV
jgi:hypothetical protein